MDEYCSSEYLLKSLDIAVRYLRQGRIVAFPTETYYGLAVDPDCASAVQKLYKAKKRKPDKPLLLLIENIKQLDSIVREVPSQYFQFIEKYWPGPLTLIFHGKKTLNQQITGNTGTVGVRISPHPIAQALVSRMGKPITATSANITGFPPARSAQEVVNALGNGVDYIIDGGQTNAGLCSTILGIQNGKLILLRNGQIDLSDELGGRQTH
jgi:L-threonylcarbamoyladenylate synthase